MKLFEYLDDKVDASMALDISITKVKEQFVVVLNPKPIVSDDAVKELNPLIIKGTAEELDEKFIEAISKPVEMAREFSVDLANFEKGQEEAKEKSAMAKQEKEKADKAAEKLEKFCKDNDSDKVKCKLECDNIFKEFPKNKKIGELRTKYLNAAPDMFSQVEETPKESPIKEKAKLQEEAIEEAKEESPISEDVKQTTQVEEVDDSSDDGQETLF